MPSWKPLRRAAFVGALSAALPLLGAPAYAAPGTVAPDRPTLRLGDYRAEVRTVQRRLRDLHYDPGAVDGLFTEDLRAALWAFKKINRLPVTTVVDARTWTALASPRRPPAFRPEGGGNRVEISLRRQVLTVFRGNRPAFITHVSTGSRRAYCERGGCGSAITPRGSFRVYRKIHKWHVGPLGAMYKPIYFHGGIAMHGSVRVPRRPASHGCVRVPLTQAAKLYRMVPKGARVYVR
ncbi:L,D-transpeptidase family protein [Actinocorallia longicatena]|uniref:L,D-transpeptidase family protein n=1 Tax=Actinocorallia longicatena TaxID=111803 RepID=A0ABP6Q2B6_9ACTN